MTSNCSLYSSLSPIPSLSLSLSLFVFTVQRRCIIQPTISGGNAQLQQKWQLRVFEINARYCSVRAEPFTQRAPLCFYLQACDFISWSSRQSQKSNKDDWLHFITAGFIFVEDLLVRPGNVEKSWNRKNYKAGMMCILLKVVQSCGNLRSTSAVNAE